MLLQSYKYLLHRNKNFLRRKIVELRNFFFFLIFQKERSKEKKIHMKPNGSLNGTHATFLLLHKKVIVAEG